MKALLFVVLVMLFCAPSFAASFAYDGVLTEEGALVTGTRQIGVTLVDPNGAAVYQGTPRAIDVVDGRFFILVGDVDDPPLGAALLEQPLAVQLTIEGDTLEPPQPIAAVPRALTVDTTEGLAFTSTGEPAQAWRIEADAASMRIVDVTAALQTPFVIEPGARANALYVRSNGDIGIGTSLPTKGLEVSRDNNDATGLTATNFDPGTTAQARLRVESDSAVFLVSSHAAARTVTRFGVTLGGHVELLHTNGNGLVLGTQNPQPVIIGTNSLARITVGGTGGVTVSGDFTATGVKNFAMVDPQDAKRAIYYSALEGPEVGTYVRGSARLKGGTAIVDLPAHFARVTEPDAITVQLTPVGAFAQLYVSEKSARRIVIKSAPGPSPQDVDVDWLVQGVRRGHKDFAVERANDLPR